MTQGFLFPGGSGSEGPPCSKVRKSPHEGQRFKVVGLPRLATASLVARIVRYAHSNPDDYPLISRYARALNALARPFAHVSRELRFPVHGSLLTKNAGGLLNAPPGNGKPAYIPDFKSTYTKILLPGLGPIHMDTFRSLSISGIRSKPFNPRAPWGRSPGRRSRRELR